MALKNSSLIATAPIVDLGIAPADFSRVAGSPTLVDGIWILSPPPMSKQYDAPDAIDLLLDGGQIFEIAVIARGSGILTAAISRVEATPAAVATVAKVVAPIEETADELRRAGRVADSETAHKHDLEAKHRRALHDSDIPIPDRAAAWQLEVARRAEDQVARARPWHIQEEFFLAETLQEHRFSPAAQFNNATGLRLRLAAAVNGPQFIHGIRLRAQQRSSR